VECGNSLYFCKKYRHWRRKYRFRYIAFPKSIDFRLSVCAKLSYTQYRVQIFFLCNATLTVYNTLRGWRHWPAIGDIEAMDWFGISLLWSLTVGLAKTTSRIDSLESNENAKCPLTVEIQLHRWAGILLLFGGEPNSSNIKRDTYNTVVLLDVPRDWFYRCPPTSGPYVLHRFRVLSLPASLRPLRPASDRILGVSHTSGVTSAFHSRLYSIYTSIAMPHTKV